MGDLGPSNTCFLGPTRAHNPNGILSRFCTDHSRASLYFTMDRPFPPKITPSHGNLDPHLTRFLGPILAHNPNGILISSAAFAQMTAECHYTLQWDTPSPPKLPILMGQCGPHLNTWFFGPTRVLKANGISIGSAVLAGLASVTD